MSKLADVQVLVVGAGPTGLTAAYELTRRGITCRIIDENDKPTPQSRALNLHARTLELFENMGIIEDALKEGTPAYGISVYQKNKRLVHVTFDELDSPYPYVLLIPQSRTELVLTNALKKLGVKVERPVTLKSFTQSGDAITCSVKNGENEETIRARWLIGCDGAHSAVRHALGLDFKGIQYDEPFALGDVRVEGKVEEDELNVYLHEAGNLLIFPYGDGRYRVMTNLTPATDTSQPLTLPELQSFADQRGPGGLKLSDPHWLAWFRLNRRSVKEYRTGRVFLAGDAARIHSPAGGQGMNTGIHDAFNIAWKLALVEKEASPEDLLETYQQERHPIGQALLKGTDAATRVITIRQPLAQKIRNDLMQLLSQQEFVQQRLLRIGTMIAVNYRRSPIVGEYRGYKQPRPASGPQSFGSTVKSWLEFAHGPAPGDRAPDAVLRDGAGKELRLFQIMQGVNHNLILFLAQDEGSDQLKSIQNLARYVQSHRLINLICITGSDTKPAILSEFDSVYFDFEESARNKYGAARSCLYLIRPDGYVGFRSEPPDLEPLLRHLKTIFV